MPQDEHGGAIEQGRAALARMRFAGSHCEGVGSDGTVWTTGPEIGSITETVPSPRLAIQKARELAAIP